MLSGNTRDLQIHEPTPGNVTAVSLSRALPDALKNAGFQRIASFDLLNGFRAVEPGNDSFLTQLGLTAANGSAAAGLDLLTTTLERHVRTEEQPAALIIDFASRLSCATMCFHRRAPAILPGLILSHSARARPAGERRQPFFNTVIWIVDKEGDLPDWFLIGNPRIRHIPIAKPDHIARRGLIRSLLRGLPGAQDATASRA